MRLNKISARTLSLVCALTLAASAGQSSGYQRGTHGGSQAPDEQAVIDGIQRYCSSSWRAAGMPRAVWEDGTQDVMIRMLERVPRREWSVALDDACSVERQQLKRAVWTVVKRESRRRHLAPLSEVSPLAVTVADDRNAADDLAELIEQALRSGRHPISSRQSQILVLLGKGYMVNEVAKKMGLTTGQVSNLKYKALCKIRRMVG